MEENGATASSSSSVPKEKKPKGKVDPLVIKHAKRCPLCSSEVRLFFSNYEEKFLMCENVDCEYPFGHEELMFVPFSYPDGCPELVDAPIKVTKQKFFTWAAEMSDLRRSEKEKPNQPDQSADNNQAAASTSTAVEKSRKKKKNKNKSFKTKQDKEREMQKCIQEIKELTVELNKLAKEAEAGLKKQKSLNKMMDSQGQSSSKLHEPNEQKDQAEEKVKIVVTPGTNGCLFNIKIDTVEEEK